MANLIVSAKSGNDWGLNELKYFRIDFENIHKFNDFFGVDEPILTGVIDEIARYPINIFENIDNLLNTGSKDISKFIKHLIFATNIYSNNETNVDTFAEHMLEMFEYDIGTNIIGMRAELNLDMCGIKVYAKPDVYLEDLNRKIKLLIQEDKSYNVSSSMDFDLRITESQMVAEAIAAFQTNNRNRRNQGIPEENNVVFPCIIMLGTYPIFYLFEITKELADNIMFGIYPKIDTIIKKYQIPSLIPYGNTLFDVDKRYKIFQCYTAFRNFII